MVSSLPPDPALFDAFVRRRYRTAAVALVIVLVFDTALMVVEHRLMIFALAALMFPLVPFLIARSTRRMVGAGGAFGLAATEDGFELVRLREGARRLQNVPTSGLKKASIHDDALEVLVVDHPEGRAQPRHRRVFVAGTTDAVYAMARELAARGIEAKPAEGMGTIAAVLAIAFGSAAGPTLLLLGIVLLVQAAMHPARGAFFQAGLALVGALSLLTVAITLWRRRTSARAAGALRRRR